MIPLILALSCVPLLEQEKEPPVPDLERIERAVAELENAFKKGGPADRLRALADHGSIADAEVVQWISRGVLDKDRSVQLASIRCLRHVPHPDAVLSLEAIYQKQKKLRKDEVLHEELLKAIGQHASPSSIELLDDVSMNDNSPRVARARIYALGMIRSPEAVDALIGFMKKTGRGRQGRGTPAMMVEMRTSLMILTGVDCGKSSHEWIAWWGKNEKGFEVTPQVGEVPARVRRDWNRYWGIVEQPARKKKGRDREKGGGDGGRS